MDAVISDGLYWPYTVTKTATGGAPGPCPDPVELAPVEPSVQPQEVRPQASVKETATNIGVSPTTVKPSVTAQDLTPKIIVKGDDDPCP